METKICHSCSTIVHVQPEILLDKRQLKDNGIFLCIECSTVLKDFARARRDNDIRKKEWLV